MMANLKLAQYEKPTTIQSYTIPAVMQGHDVVAVAQTGKTVDHRIFEQANVNQDPERRRPTLCPLSPS